MVKLKVPSTLGVPVSPVLVSDKPGGNAPDVKLNVRLPVPPLTVMVLLYTAVAVQSGSVDNVIAGLTVIVRLFVPDLFRESVTITVNVDAPAAVGVPEMLPVVGSRLSPTGNAPPVTE
jgi:hypothetical protein